MTTNICKNKNCKKEFVAISKKILACSFECVKHITKDEK